MVVSELEKVLCFENRKAYLNVIFSHVQPVNRFMPSTSKVADMMIASKYLLN